MTTVKFDKSVKYQGVRRAAHEVFQVADGDVPALVRAGATILSVDTPSPADESPEAIEPESAEQAPDQQSDEDIAQLKVELLQYTVSELVEFAKDRGIDLLKKTKKADIYNIIVAHLN